MTIDIHTHVFNVRYLPLEGIIKARAPWWSRLLVLALVKYLIRRSQDDPVIDGGSEAGAASAAGAPAKSEIDRLLTSTLSLSESESEILLKELIDEAVEDEDLLYEAEILQAVAEARGEASAETAAASDADTDAVLKLIPAEFESLAALLPSGAFESESEAAGPFAEAAVALGESRPFGREQRRGIFGWLFGKFAELGNFFKWAVFMTNPESEIMDTLIRTYAPTGTTPDGVKLFVDHMMDMEKHYPGKTPYYETPAIRSDRMRKLLRHSNGTVIGFYAWCPLRNDCMELVEAALFEKGFCGVKFYPPNGYRASGNAGMDEADLDCDVVRNGVTGVQIDERNEALFALCEANEIPIFSHCQPGEMESVANYTGRMSHPRFWEPVLERHPNLLLCLGHAGGARHWVADFEGNDPWNFSDDDDTKLRKPCCKAVKDPVLDEPSYARAVVELCTAGHPNVFSGTGAHDEILDGNNLRNFQRRLELLFDRSDFGDHLIYGSDWHMIYKHSKHHDYRENYESIFQDPSPLKDYRDRFFGGNALAFLRLDKFLERSRDHLTTAQVEQIEIWLA